jgi:probable rRNA maturation factor
MTIQMFNQTGENLKVYEDILVHVFDTIRKKHPMNIIFIKDQEMIELNLTYRGKDATTDVLTFPSDANIVGTIGDVFINIEKVKSQALAYGHSELREVSFLAVHGYLHILGYDHHTVEDEKKMIEAQEKILKKAGLERK